MKICFVASHPTTISVFMGPLIEALLAAGHTVSAVANTREVGLLREQGLDVDFIHAPIERRVEPLRDLRALVALVRIFRTGRFDVVHSLTSKVGILATQAACLARVPLRVHCFTGQSWAVRRGWKRTFLKRMDRLTASFATHPLADSPSQMAFLESEGVVRPGKMVVPGHGSISGVDLERFRPDPQMRREMRAEFGLAESDVLILFLARVRRSKGVPELLEAFSRLSREVSSAHLAVVGPTEEAELKSLFPDQDPRVHRIDDYVRDHERYLLAADIFCLPSHYEGFGSVVIEAAACGVPAVVANVYGLTDAVLDRETGLLHQVRDVSDLTSKLLRLTREPELRASMGKSAHERARTQFSRDEIIRQYLAFYLTLAT